MYSMYSIHVSRGGLDQALWGPVYAAYKTQTAREALLRRLCPSSSGPWSLVLGHGSIDECMAIISYHTPLLSRLPTNLPFLHCYIKSSILRFILNHVFCWSFLVLSLEYSSRRRGGEGSGGHIREVLYCSAVL